MLKLLTLSDVREILDDVECGDFRFRLTENEHGMFLQAELWRENVNTGEWEWGRGGKSYISPYSAENELIQRALGSCLAFVEHEVREHFKWRGRAIYNPHIDHKKQWEIANDREYRQ